VLFFFVHSQLCFVVVAFISLQLNEYVLKQLIFLRQFLQLKDHFELSQHLLLLLFTEFIFDMILGQVFFFDLLLILFFCYFRLQSLEQLLSLFLPLQ
jgi:hypothetical protein